MKKIIFSISFLLLSIGFISAQTDRPITFGIHVLAGGRYDDVRMCVASQSGVKGGPIVDIYFDIRFPAGENGTIALNIPVMRPILFGFAFSMLQFEPQVTYEYHFGEPGSPRFVLSGGSRRFILCDGTAFHCLCRSSVPGEKRLLDAWSKSILRSSLFTGI
jgi:hypothetical protein